jgi:signal transduction histidine kinase
VVAGVILRAGQGQLSVLPARRTRLIAALAAAWILLVLALGGWWLTLLVRQARTIAELQARSGSTDATVRAQWENTRLMVVGESGAFLFMLLALTALLAWLYLRESRRARAMQAFFAAVTHELRTPLTSIRLQAEAIAEGDQRAELARRLLEDSGRLESQIDKTLELARIEGGGPLAEQAIPLAGWLPRTLSGIAAAHGTRLELDLHVPPELPPVLADAAALQMIMRNLLENSVRHAGRERVRVQVSARAGAGGVHIEYRDDGAGSTTPGVRLGRLFGRGDGSDGSGVGLYLVRALAQRMGGRVEFDTAPGAGFLARLQLRAGDAVAGGDAP